jgi:hypothetical protein
MKMKKTRGRRKAESTLSSDIVQLLFKRKTEAIILIENMVVVLQGRVEQKHGACDYSETVVVLQGRVV